MSETHRISLRSNVGWTVLQQGSRTLAKRTFRGSPGLMAATKVELAIACEIQPHSVRFNRTELETFAAPSPWRWRISDSLSAANVIELEWELDTPEHHPPSFEVWLEVCDS